MGTAGKRSDQNGHVLGSPAEKRPVGYVCEKQGFGPTGILGCACVVPWASPTLECTYEAIGTYFPVVIG